METSVSVPNSPQSIPTTKHPSPSSSEAVFSEESAGSMVLAGNTSPLQLHLLSMEMYPQYIPGKDDAYALAEELVRSGVVSSASVDDEHSAVIYMREANGEVARYVARDYGIWR